MDKPPWDRFLCRAAGLLIRLYRRLLSPLLGRHCRFYPSCSEYAQEAFEKKRFFVALRLSAWRLLKCQPFHPGGYDPLEEPEDSEQAE